MTDFAPIRHKLVGISPKAYEHPTDRAMTAALASIPMLDRVIKQLSEMQIERAYRQFLLANSVRVGPNQLPELWESYQHVLETLDMPDSYELYLMQTPVANAFTFGTKTPIVVLHSGLIDLLDEDEIQAVLAHEVAHILSGHSLYRTVLILLILLGQASQFPLFVGLPLQAVQLALLEWFRAAELSCDRAATLVVRDPRITCRAMMHLAGGNLAERLNLDAFIQQAQEYEESNEGYDRFLRLFQQMGATHPFPVRRVSELLKWIQGGDFDRIIRGSYPSRDEKPDARQEVNEAANYYREHFERVMEETNRGVQSVGQQFSDWLRRSSE
ncbi:MAG: M48 family metallopeptidase [Anaerolineales bacterium]|nr:M48 family metallopeptidase [Anaerolineales bacterium]MCB9126380.1 M48 family metallopeptidase [Ardenticatenales bacterium]MCB9171541.1 M48 family metallopeptidase [Ardenticatenales bacterium]